MNEPDAVMPTAMHLAEWLCLWDHPTPPPRTDLFRGLIFAPPHADHHAAMATDNVPHDAVTWYRVRFPSELAGQLAHATRYDVVIVADVEGIDQEVATGPEPGLMAPAARLVADGGHLLGGRPCPPADTPTPPPVTIADMAARGLALLRWQTDAYAELYHFQRLGRQLHNDGLYSDRFQPISPGAFHD